MRSLRLAGVVLAVLLSLLVAWTPVGAAPAATGASPSAAVPAPVFVPLSPARLLDTRGGTTTVDGQAAGGGAVGAGDANVRTVPIAGRGGVPATGVSAVVLNITATEPTAATFVTVYPAGTTRPTASNLNVRAGQTIPNLVVAKLGGGSVSLFNLAGSTHLIADVAGYFRDGSAAFTPTAPMRFLDTRAGHTTIDGQAKGIGAAGPGGVVDLTITGRSGLPGTGVGSVVLNVTATGPTDDTYVTVYPTGATPPTASNINLRAGETVPNLVIAKVGAGGKLSLRNFTGATHLVADVVGWFAEGTPDFTGLSPARLTDTRVGGTTIDGEELGMGAVGPGRAGFPEEYERLVQVTGRGQVPAEGVGAVVLNVTAVANAPTHLTVHPSNRALPNASNLNAQPFVPVANLVIAPVGSDGSVAVHNFAGFTTLVVDVVGWFPAVPAPSGPVRTWGCPEFDTGVCQYLSPDPAPVPVEGLVGGSPVVDLASGAHHSLALRQDGSVVAWGNNLSGALGNPSVASTSEPVAVAGLGAGSGVIAVEAGWMSSYALKSDGTVLAWGFDVRTVKNPAPTYLATPTVVTAFGPGSGVTAIRAGQTSAVALRGDDAMLWGTLAPAPSTPVEISTAAKDVALGHDHLLVLGTDGAVSARGANDRGQLGTGTTAPVTGPITPVGLADDVVHIAVGLFSSFAVRADGSVLAWGQNYGDRLGVGSGSVPVAAQPSPVTGLGAGSGVVEIVAGNDHAVIRRADGSVWAWGVNNAAETGSTAPGSEASVVVEPVPVDGFGPGSGVTRLAAGGSHTLALVS